MPGKLYELYDDDDSSKETKKNEEKKKKRTAVEEHSNDDEEDGVLPLSQCKLGQRILAQYEKKKQKTKRT